MTRKDDNPGCLSHPAVKALALLLVLGIVCCGAPYISRAVQVLMGA